MARTSPARTGKTGSGSQRRGGAVGTSTGKIQGSRPARATGSTAKASAPARKSNKATGRVPAPAGRAQGGSGRVGADRGAGGSRRGNASPRGGGGRPGVRGGAPAKQPPWAIIGGVGGGVVLLLLIIVMMSGGEPPKQEANNAPAQQPQVDTGHVETEQERLDREFEEELRASGVNKAAIDEGLANRRNRAAAVARNKGQ